MCIRDRHAGDDALSDAAFGDLVADLDDRPGALVADDVGRRRHLTAGTVEGVATLDADRLDADHHVAGPTLRVGDLFVAEHLGSAGLVVHLSLIHISEPTRPY